MIFWNNTDKFSDVVKQGGVIFTPLLPLVVPAYKITISNVPPFIKNEVLAQEPRLCGLVSPIIKVSLDFKPPLL